MLLDFAAPWCGTCPAVYGVLEQPLLRLPPVRLRLPLLGHLDCEEFQLDERSHGSTLNVANFIVMRVSGKDSHELASQFDNTPPDPEVRIEAVYQPYRLGDGEP